MLSAQSMKKIIFVILLILALVSIVNSVNSIYVLLRKRDLLLAAKKSLTKEQQDNKNLKKQLQSVSSTAFIEEEARNKLFFVRPGEHTVFIAKSLVETPTPHASKPVEMPNWQQWIQVFTQ